MTNTDNAHALRECVVVLLEDAHGRIALQLRDDLAGVGHRDHWGLFGGLLEPGEDPVSAAIRETREELGAALDAKRLRLLRSFETDTRLCVRLFHYPVGEELDGAVLREGQRYGWFAPESIKAGVIGAKRVVLQHLAMMEWYWNQS